MNENDTNSILGKILNEVQIVNSYLKTTAETSAKTAVNTKSIRQDLRAVREGKTGTSALTGIDPLTRPKREEVNRVKELIREHRKTNPRYPLLSVLDDGANHFHDRSCIHGKRKFTISGYTSTQVGS